MSSVGRGDLILTIVRPLAIIVALLAVYWFAPLDGDGVIVTVMATAVVGLLVFSAVFVHQVRRIRRSRTPTLTAVEALVLVYGTFLIQFSVLYVALSATDPTAFDEPLNRMAGIYLSITILSTVGFGDISATSDLARLIVSVQMVADIVLIATAVRVLTAPLKRQGS